MANDDPRGEQVSSTLQHDVFAFFKDHNYFFLYLIGGIPLFLAISPETTLGPLSFKSSAEGTERWVLLVIALIFLLPALLLHLTKLGLIGHQSSRIEPVEKIVGQVEKDPFLRNSLDLNDTRADYEDHKKVLSTGKFLGDWMYGEKDEIVRKVIKKVYLELDENQVDSIDAKDFSDELSKLFGVLVQNIRDGQHFSLRERNIDVPKGRAFVYTKALTELKEMTLKKARMDIPGNVAIEELLVFFSDKLIKNVQT